MSRFQLLSDAQWSLIESMLPRPTGRKGRPFSDARMMLEGIIYRYRCGIAWRDLPEVFGPWQTVWTWHHRMASDGTWDRVLGRLTTAADAAGLIDWSLSVDSTVARAHQHVTNTTRTTGGGSNYTNLRLEPADHGIGRSRGGLSTKIHQLVDGNGLPRLTLITPGQAGDSPMLLPLMEQLRVGRAKGRPRTRPDALRGDKAYSSRAIRTHLRCRGIKAVIPEPDDQKGHRKRRGPRGGRPVGLDRADYKNRNVIERRFCNVKQWRALATRYDKHAIIYRAAVLIQAAIAWTRQLSDTP
ncbi:MULTISPECIES: IS5 family transposase [Arthrobacter]|uniref:IS5 family transposase n=2 Tax=Arthrobacter TaxID=1663 RepID=A0ABU9KGF6_9MICC|nr:IS5 family transposase [Arthrobacter sp. YJM1]MDP5225868.1 IS5 family transposase [Arthrobacter sp. YJM1]